MDNENEDDQLERVYEASRTAIRLPPTDTDHRH
jgi:hypothetical protein